GGLVEPTGDRVPPAHGGCLAREDEEGGLEGILRIRAVAQDAPAHAQDHRPVAADEGGEGGLVALVAEPAKQFAVGGVLSRLSRGAGAEVTHQKASLAAVHDFAPAAVLSVASPPRNGRRMIF